MLFGDDVMIFSEKHIAFQDKDLKIAWPR